MSGPRGRDDEFFEVDGHESGTLHHDSLDEAVESFLDMVEPDAWPSELTVFGYRRAKVDPAELLALEIRIFEMIYEHLDQEYGDPDGETSTRPEVREAVKSLMETVQRTYVPWACERDEAMTTEVDVAKWVRENNPKGIEDEKTLAAVRRLEEE